MLQFSLSLILQIQEWNEFDGAIDISNTNNTFLCKEMKFGCEMRTKQLQGINPGMISSSLTETNVKA